MALLTHLTDRYVTERLNLGELTRPSARQLRYRLAAFACHTKVPPEQLRRRHVEAWLSVPGLSAHYRRARLSAVRGFCQWAVLNRHMPADPTLGVKFAKLPPLLPRALTLDQSQKVASTAAAWPDRRAPLIVSLMLSEGLRRGEVAAIQLGDLDRRAGVLAVRGKGGQGGVTARLPLTEETRRLLARYLPSVPGSSGPLFRNERRPEYGISPSRVGEIVRAVMIAAGVKEYAYDGRSAHALRHTAAQDLVDRGVDMRSVQKVLRHASIRNTELYVRGEVRGLRDVMEGRTYFQ
jgi:integrase